jgi:hypothetical protein
MSNGPRRAPNGKLLCVGHLSDDISHLHRVAERAMDQIGLEPHFLVTAPDRLIDEPRQYLASNDLREVDTGVEHVAHYGPQYMQVALWGDRRFYRAIPNPVLRYRALRQANLSLARKILKKVRPSAILATVDACHDLFLAEATRQGIPTIFMQFALWGDRSFYRELWADDQRATAGSMTLRQQLTGHANKLIQQGFGLHNRPTWWRDCSRIAVLGPYWADLLTRGGIPRQRIAVTGNPLCDEIHGIRSGRQGRLRELYERLGLPAGTRYFLHCRENHGRFNGWKGLAAGASEESERQIIEAFKAASPLTPIVVKMHPRETPEDYDFVRSIDPSVIVVGDVPLTELLAQSMLMVTTTSATQLWSAALDRPTISAFFWKGLDYWEKATAFSGVERVFTPQQLRASVSCHMNDSAHQSLWRQKRRAFAEEMLVVDGDSVERLVQLLQDPFYDRRGSN